MLVADRIRAVGAAVDDLLADIVGHQIRGAVLGEGVGVRPGNAVGGDVVLAILETANGKAIGGGYD
jgi:hypothetical protein